MEKVLVVVVLSDLQVETQQSVKVRDSVTLTCNSSCTLPQQTFIWYKNTQKHTGIVKENQLQLESVSRDDTGNYQCAVSGYERLISPPVYLKVEWGDGQQDWGVNYSPSYVCALKGSTVKISCTLKYPSGYKIETVFWTKPAVTDGELPKLCLVPQKSGRVQCDRENNNTYSITLTDVTEADKHIYYCRFTTNLQGGKWTGIPGAHLDVTGRVSELSEIHHRHIQTHIMQRSPVIPVALTVEHGASNAKVMGSVPRKYMN
uniref:Ig-like domain-containing protein n=1 Tax=Cyprinus carpio TaxID=7962 RepID=A0A8C2BZH4_CYPCA